MSKRYYIDTEFNERPGLLDLISIGLVCEDGREFYEVSSEFRETDCNAWVRANVLPKIDAVGRAPRAKIRDDLRAFIGDDKPEFWGYFSDYDWVLFCWLFGAMVDLPTGWPMFCLDLKQVMHERGITKDMLPPQPRNAHHALVDAHWIRQAHAAMGYHHAAGAAGRRWTLDEIKAAWLRAQETGRPAHKPRREADLENGWAHVLGALTGESV